MVRVFVAILGLMMGFSALAQEPAETIEIVAEAQGQSEGPALRGMLFVRVQLSQMQDEAWLETQLNEAGIIENLERYSLIPFWSYGDMRITSRDSESEDQEEDDVPAPSFAIQALGTVEQVRIFHGYLGEISEIVTAQASWYDVDSEPIESLAVENAVSAANNLARTTARTLDCNIVDMTAVEVRRDSGSPFSSEIGVEYDGIFGIGITNEDWEFPDNPVVPIHRQVRATYSATCPASE